MLKIVVFAPMPSARDNAASALTSGRRRSTRAANRKSRQKFSICFLPRRPLSSSRLDGAACAPETTLRHRGREGSRGCLLRGQQLDGPGLAVEKHVARAVPEGARQARAVAALRALEREVAGGGAARFRTDLQVLAARHGEAEPGP